MDIAPEDFVFPKWAWGTYVQGTGTWSLEPAVADARQVNGTRQVTINGQPLYLHAGDQRPGDATGEGVDGVWFTVRPWGAEGGFLPPTNPSVKASSPSYPASAE